MVINKKNTLMASAIIVTGSFLSVTTLSFIMLSVLRVSALDTAVDDISITVPTSCSLTSTLDSAHTETINIGTNVDDIGTTTIKVFCNDSEGFAIYAAGYTGDVIGGTNSNKLIGTNNQTSIGNIDTGIATSGATSNWSMKLIKVENEQGQDPVAYNPANLTIESDTNGSFANYHIVPNEYTKVASFTSTTDATLGSVLQTTYQAYISPTQSAGTYAGKVIYTLVHPATAIAPVHPDQIGVNYNANGLTFANNTTKNYVVYGPSCTTMYIATTPLISKTDNIGDDGTQNGSYQATEGTPVPITATGATKMKVVIRYGFSAGTMMAIIEGNWDGGSEPGNYEMIQGPATGTATYIFNGDAVTFFMMAESAPSATDGQDYGYFAEVYPIYTTEQANTEAISICEESLSPLSGTYATTTNWYGSWYADINNVHYDFMDEAEVISFLNDNASTLSGTTIDLMRGLTFTEAYTRANKTQDNGYYKQQELTKSMCNTIAITQNQTLKDTRDNSTYMVGKLKDGNCWMLDNLALDPTDNTTAQNLNAGNTNATNEAITNYLNGGNSNNTTGWSNVAVADVDTDFHVGGYTTPRINNASKDTLVTSYGPASTNGQAKVGIYYNYCAATVGTYCYEEDQGVDVPNTDIDASQDLCPANWRMPTGGSTGEYSALYNKYNTTDDATNVASLQYNLSAPLSGYFYNSSAYDQNGWGRWWSSTYYGGYYMYTLDVNPTRVYPYSFLDRSYGISLRCLVGE